MLPFLLDFYYFCTNNGSVVQWIEWKIPVLLIGVRVPTGSLRKKPSGDKVTQSL